MKWHAYGLSTGTKMADLERRNGHYFAEFGRFRGQLRKSD